MVRIRLCGRFAVVVHGQPIKPRLPYPSPANARDPPPIIYPATAG